MCGGGFAISPRMILPSSLEWHPQCCFLGCGSSTALVVVQLLSRIRLWPRRLQMPRRPLPFTISQKDWTLYVFTCTQFTVFWMNICSKVPCGFPCSVWRGPMSTMGEVSQEAPCLGSLLFSQPALLLVLPAGLQELAFTCLNLDTSSMETYMYIHILFFPLSEESSVLLHKYRRLPTASRHRATQPTDVSLCSMRVGTGTSRSFLWLV